MMIRKSTLHITQVNKGKIDLLDSLVTEMTVVINKFITTLWQQKDFKSKFVNFKIDTWLSARLQQCLGKQALEIVKSQRKRKKKTMPVFGGTAFNLDSRFVDFQFNNNSFDIWVRLTSIGNKIKIKLPAKKHKHFNKFNSWDQSKSIRLIKRHDKYSVECFFEKEESGKKEDGDVVGVDCGYKELLVDSSGKSYDQGMEHVYEKIARKKQGSKAFKRSLVERDNLTNQSVNKLDLSSVKELVCEDLVNIKKGTKGKIRKSFTNKLQRWVYAKVLQKLTYLCEEKGVVLTKVPPAYTSQKCSACGVICKTNRKGKSYKCACGLEIDADFNAAINISHMGVYSPHVLQNIC